MSEFIPLKRNCPICDGARRDCRQNKQNGIVHCRANLNVIPQNWKALGQDKWGFEMYAPASDEHSLEGWQRRQWEQKAQRQRELEELRRGALPEAERDQAIRRIHRYFRLGQRHRRNLRDRGLSDSHIDSLPYFTLHPAQEVPPFTPANLSGVRRGKLAVKKPGFACPIPNIDGLIIGWQNRFDDTSNGKYRWTSGEKSAHLPNGELPIGVYRPDSEVKRYAIGHSEGFLKADIIAQLWGLPTLGAASANFTASPEQWRLSLEKLSTELGTKEVRWFADAGAVNNPNVTKMYQRAWEKLTEWGYLVWVVWYGQTEKSVGDADEISQEIRESARLIAIDEYLTLAQEHGGIREEPSSYITSRRELDKYSDRTIDRDQWELKFGVGAQILKRFKRLLSWQKSLQGSGKLQPKLAPDHTFQQASQRLTAWQDAVQKGYRYILDTSAPGLGKSHTAGIALPEAFGVEKLWYLANDHRNPTTGIIENNYIDLPVRHNGLKIDNSRKTPNGNPFLVHPKPGEEPDTRGNCFKTNLFQQFRAKNLNVEAAKTSRICQACRAANLCKNGSGQKYGASFRGDRKNALAFPRIRAHADSMPNPDDFDYSASGIIWDEIGTQLKPMDSVTVTLADFDQTWAELEAKSPELHESLKILRLALRPLLSGELKQPYHGWDDAGIRAILPHKPDNLREIITELEIILQPDLKFLEEQPDSITADEARNVGISKSAQRLVNREFRRQAHQEFSEGFQRLALNWLVPFLKVWNGESGAFRCEWQQMSIFTKCARHAAVAQAAKFNIFLDATINRERLAMLLGVDPSEIYVVGQETPNHANLKIIQVNGLGKLGKDRSDSLEKRIAALRKALEDRYPGIVFGDWKSHGEAGDGQWFVNLRGSNEFQNAPVLAVFGVPYQNIGYLQALYQTLTGEFAPLDKENPHEGLQRFIESHVQAEIEQAVGRLRVHLRPSEQLTFIFVGNYDLGFLGCEVEQVEAFQICPEAGTLAQITRWKILETVRQLRDQEQKITQQAIASVAGISQPLIAKIASLFGGWQSLKKLLLMLLDPLNSDSNNFASLSDEEKWFAQSYLPLVIVQPETAIEEVAMVCSIYGVRTFLRILGAATPHTQARLLALLLQALSFHTELVVLVEGGVRRECPKLVTNE
jgi:hypothetical protein